MDFPEKMFRKCHKKGASQGTTVFRRNSFVFEQMVLYGISRGRNEGDNADTTREQIINKGKQSEINIYVFSRQKGNLFAIREKDFYNQIPEAI